jgi:CRP/FNR family transcriptional regulator, nitrogen oxide reductase regulator
MPRRKGSPLKQENVQPEQCSINRRMDILGRSTFFAGMRDDDIRYVNTFFHEVGYESGEAIYYAGEEANSLYVVAAGKVKLTRHNLSGQDVLLEMLAPGDFFGTLSLLADACYPDTAQAQTQLCVLRIDVRDFQSILLRYPTVAVVVLQEMALRLHVAQETIRQLSTFPVERRIASILLALGKKLGEESEQGLLLQIPFSRQELADMAGATVETTSRVISKWEQGGLVHSGREWIAIVNVTGLAALAEEK